MSDAGLNEQRQNSDCAPGYSESNQEGPKTVSHSLAIAAHGDKGTAQQEHDQDVRDLGWNAPLEHIPAPLVGGLSNEYLWMLVRRFNKQIYHVKEVKTSVPGDLDLNIADEDDFSPDKLRSTVERIYMTVGIGLITFAKHISRLRSWHERRRTAAFCASYFLAWICDILIPTLTSVIIALLLFPSVRSFLFPPAPLSLVSGKTGGIQKPPAGVLGSVDSVTGAPQQYQGEAVEQEAGNFVNGIAHVALSSATGKEPSGDPNVGDNSPGSAAPDPTDVAVGAGDARTSAGGSSSSSSRDKTKRPMEAAMWNKMRPAMHSLQDIVDGWERFANALSPTAPFPRDSPRLRLASLLVPLLAVSLVVTPYVIIKSLWFAVGFGFFGDPVITRAFRLLNEKFPNWQQTLELRNTILKGTPTNAQLTITLLRIGETNKSPLPPPLQTQEPPTNTPTDMTEEHIRAMGTDAPLGARQAQIEEAVSHDPSSETRIELPDVAASKNKSHGPKSSKVLNVLRSGLKGSVTTAIGADKLKAASGSARAKNRLGALPKPGFDLTSGPIEFKSRFHGKKGHTYISTNSAIPRVSFTMDSAVKDTGTQDREDLHPVWELAISDISALKKLGGYGWKARLVVGWATEREVADGLEITTRNGDTLKVTAIPLRNELFNRLIAIGDQKWESW